MKTTVGFVLLIAFSLLGCGRINQDSKEGLKVTGTKNPLISLNGYWKFSMNPPEEFWKHEVSAENWQDILVPGECAMQGFAIKHDVPYAYKTTISIPADYKNKVVKLKFDGVYSYTRVWVNGHFVREHYGGFTAWECNITDFVSPGELAELTVEITDKRDEISYGSGYAKHQIGGILRSVWLMALPENHLSYLYVETDLDESFQDANMFIQVKPDLQTNTSLIFRLYDPAGRKVSLAKSRFELTGEKQTIAIPVSKPFKWDTEHPNLYTLVTELYDPVGKSLYSKTQKIGFREVEVKGNQLFVNGSPVKLRGACRHDIHPLLGRTTTPEYDKKDVLLAKEANMNFIRTSHYPPSETFLAYCDEFGIYVEDESAVCFVNTHRTKDYNLVKQSGPEFKYQHLSQVEEMLHYHRNHPSVIIWSVGNENMYDGNFKLAYEFVKRTDPTRPVMFSYPGNVPDTVKCFEILSMHYPPVNGDLSQWGLSTKGFEYDDMPALYDEWAHVACYNKPTLKLDPNVRNFWGQSLDSMWINIFESKGGLGGAIWGYIDETFMLPDTISGFTDWWGKMDKNVLPAMYEGHCVGYGEWGIIDTWRRKKPEFWNTKKAYSPVRVLTKTIEYFYPGATISIPVHNRFDHTDLNELSIKWWYRDQTGKMEKANIPPHQKGTINIAGNDWQDGENIKLQFYRNDTCLVDEYNLYLGAKKIELPVCQSGRMVVSDNDSIVLFTGKAFNFILNKQSGLINDFCIGTDTLIKSGPWLNLKVPGTRPYYSTISMDDLGKNWQLDNVKYEIKEGIANIFIKGKHGKIAVDYHLVIDDNGTIEIQYSLQGAPGDKKVQELGLKFLTGSAFKKLAWKRDAYWTAYPAMHLGVPEGETDLTYKVQMKYREYPEHAWEFDNKNFYYHGMEKELPLSNIARSLKEYIYSYTLVTPANNQLSVLDKGAKACRFNVNEKGSVLFINSLWDYSSLLWGNYMKNISLQPEYLDEITLQIGNKE